MPTFEKGYFRVRELMEKWGIGREELLYQVFSQQLIPSYFLKARFAQTVRFTENEECDLVADEDFLGEYTSGIFVYLRSPRRSSLTECLFNFGSEDAREQPDLIPFWTWYIFDEPVSSDDNDMVFLKSQVDAFEKKHFATSSAITKTDPPITYPWGTHTTHLLNQLSAAATKFWSLYDPADATTAPTNEQVAQWLVERGVAERTANVIATILRTDGLKMGRRK